MPFDTHYTALYDHFYADKDYDGECDLLEQVFARCEEPPHTVLDLGCGTGEHALRLAARGYRVTGLDRSLPMLEAARQKCRQRGAALELCHADITGFELGRQVDAVISMFAVLGYVTTNQGLAETLARVRRHLRPGGVFVFDCWYGPAVLRLRPETRLQTFELDGGGRVLRLVVPELDERHHLVRVSYRLLHLEGGRILEETVETHDMRFFFPLEVENLLAQAGFERVTLSAFGALDREPTSEDWNLMVVAS